MSMEECREQLNANRAPQAHMIQTHHPAHGLATELVETIGCVHHQHDMHGLQFPRRSMGHHRRWPPPRSVAASAKPAASVGSTVAFSHLVVMAWTASSMPAERPAQRLRLLHASVARCYLLLQQQQRVATPMCGVIGVVVWHDMAQLLLQCLRSEIGSNVQDSITENNGDNEDGENNK